MENNTSITKSIKEKIETSITWARYAAIISFVNLGLSLLQLLIGVISGNIDFVKTFGFLISAAITLVMSINLLNYSKFAKIGANNADSVSLYQSLHHLRIYFIVMGILFMIAIGLLGLFLIFGIITAIIS